MSYCAQAKLAAIGDDATERVKQCRSDALDACSDLYMRRCVAVLLRCLVMPVLRHVPLDIAAAEVRVPGRGVGGDE